MKKMTIKIVINDFNNNIKYIDNFTNKEAKNFLINFISELEKVEPENTISNRLDIRVYYLSYKILEYVHYLVECKIMIQKNKYINALNNLNVLINSNRLNINKELTPQAYYGILELKKDISMK